jgi:hypothetical protein
MLPLLGLAILGYIISFYITTFLMVYENLFLADDGILVS